MFRSATVKLTAWYLLILMSISLLFSVIIYQVAMSEINARLESLQLGILSESDVSLLPQYDLRTLRNLQTHEASSSLLVGLVYANLLILATGGVGSYLLARRTLEPIERVHEAQSRFTSDASHELRTPLSAMKTELEVLLRDKEATKADMREVLESNLEEVNKLTDLSHTLLQLSRLDHRGLPFTRVAFDSIIQDAIERHKKRDRKLVFTPHSKPLFINAHQNSVEELLSILLDNAIKYSPLDSTVTLKLTKHNKRARLAITNKGEGIPAQQLPFIFDRFYRADASRTGGAKSGYGLGLSLAKKIIELHSGEIDVVSVPHKRTTFTLILPLFSGNKTRES